MWNHFDLYATNQTFDLSNVYQDLVKENELLGFESKNRFYEIGSLVGIKDLSKHLNKN